MKSIYIYGASGHGLVVADIAKACGYTDIIFVDDGNNEYQNFEDIKDRSHIPIALGIGSNLVRDKLFTKLNNHNFEIKTLIHPSATISKESVIGLGTVVMPNSVVNANAKIGKGVILNTGSIVEHECIIDDYSHISPNVALAGNVTIGKFTHIGIGTSIIQGVIIGKNCIIGAGSVVVKNIESNKKAYGNPCIEVGNISGKE